MSLLNVKPSVLATTVGLALAGVLAGCSTGINTVKTNDHTQEAKNMLAHMTLQEKLKLLSGPGMNTTTYKGITAVNVKEGKAVDGVAGYINGVKNSQLDVPAVKLADGPAGLRIAPTRKDDSHTYYATAWPVGTLLASSWDTQLVHKVGMAMGNEVKEYGVDVLLAPGMNIQRNPLLGRNFEYYSEDPLVAGDMGAAMVSGIQQNGVGATIKHFVANNAETNRFFSDSIVDPRALREIYMRAFQIAVTQAQPWAVMTSYNLVNGTYANHRADLLQDVLRKEWGFDGVVMSDWFAGNVAGLSTDFKTKVPRDALSAANQILAGNNLIQPGDATQDLQAAYQSGLLTDQAVDASATHILNLMQKTPSYHHYHYSDQPDLQAHAKLSLQAATESMVLLKNSAQALPLNAGSKVALFGTNQINTLKGGTGSGDVNAAYTQSIAAAMAKTFALNQQVTDFYRHYWQAHKYQSAGLLGHYDMCDEPLLAENKPLQKLIEQSALSDSAAVITIARQAGEGEDRTATKGDYLLSDGELALIDAVSKAFHAQHKKVTVVLNVNGLVDTSWSNKVDGILLAYMGGQDTGEAISELLAGTVNPSGKLAQTIPLHYTDVPSAKTFPGTDTNHDGLADSVYYNEGIFVGYRYYTSFNKAVAYPFGYGLSYTHFDYVNPELSTDLNTQQNQGKLQVSVTVKNTGPRSGKEAVQVYVSAPQGQLVKPAIELKGFAKTALLPAGQSQTLTMNIDAQTLASFDATHNAWILEPGEYKVYVAPSSDVANVKPLTFHLDKEIVVAKTTPDALALPAGVSKKDFMTVTE